MKEKNKISVKVMLNGEEIIIHKLKAGKYYEAQNIYIGMIDAVRKQTMPELKPQKGKKITAENISEDDIKITADMNVTDLYKFFPLEIAKLVAFCIDIEVEKLLEDAYPEDITDIANKVIELNNFNENLKNSVAPLGNLGAGKN